MKTGLAFLHGWGYGPETWEQWAAAFPGRPVALLDMGYFGPQRLELPHSPGGWLGVGHSQGFVRLLGLPVPWRGLVGFGGFLRFCTRPGKPGGTPPETIDAMTARLDTAAGDVLNRFLRRCDHKGACPPPPEGEGLQRLREGLLYLRGLDLTPGPVGLPPILLLHAANDRIVSPLLAREAQDRLPGAGLQLLDDGGHALPFTRVDQCLPPVREFLHDLA
jgi:pimeloyl-[acyl-carrier protein] methyl ester esterase